MTVERDRCERQPAAARVAAVVLNYLTPDDTLLAVRALLISQPRPHDIIVVDNDRERGAERTLAPVRGEIIYIATGENLGFSGGMNVGIRSALTRAADYVALVNSDVIVTPGCLDVLLRTLEARSDARIAGPMVLGRSSPDTILSLGLSFNRITGRMRESAFGKHRRAAGPLRPRRMDAVSGCCMLIAAAVFEQTGLLDEDYFFGFEDLDFCLAARRKGFTTIVVPEAIAFHEGSRSIGTASPRRHYFAARNHLRLARRAAPAGVPGSLFRGLSIVALNLAHAARGPLHSAPARLHAVLRGTRDHWRSRYGAGS